ncbi:MAG: type II secretion system F family protein, partial [Bacteriovoracaceae bacterium]|nr:type II secretion system F family protein [Bacteriovoracaceae bacterium]
YQVGADIAPILKALSAEVRQKRATLAEIRGNKASSMMLLPLMFFIVPASLIAIAAPLVMNFLRGD